MNILRRNQILTGLMAAAGMAVSFSLNAAPRVIIDNTGSNSTPGITTNLPTMDGAGCSKNNVLVNNSCNSFDIDPNRMQVINRTATDTIEGAVGVTDPKAGAYSKKGTAQELKYFAADEHAFDLDKLRAAADNLSSPALVAAIQALPVPPPPNTYGTITWPQFIANVANGTTMFGLVRVKVPLDTKGAAKVKFCPKNNKPLSDKCGCAPDSSTDLSVGSLECGSTLGANAQMNVRGSLFFDWIDCDTGAPVSLANLKNPGEELKIKVEIPINVNPANPTGPLNVVGNLPAIADLTCMNTPCDKVIGAAIPFALVPQSSIDTYLATTGKTLNAAEFGTLSRAEQYHLLLPSGYVDGWATAFATLNIGATTWQGWGFGISDGGSITREMIRADTFEDIPALIYTGGLVDMHSHVNVSGLTYIPQSIELEQKTPDAMQYFSGAVMVRDGFYFEGDPSGTSTTYFANDPSTYSKIRLSNTSAAAAKFEPFTPPVKGTTGPGPQWIEIRPRPEK